MSYRLARYAAGPPIPKCVNNKESRTTLLLIVISASSDTPAKCDGAPANANAHNAGRTGIILCPSLCAILYPTSDTPSTPKDVPPVAMITDFATSLLKAETEEDFFCAVKDFYHTYGVGDFGIHKAFYMQDDGGLVPVSHIREVTFEDIYGYDSQKARLIQNTASFTAGGGANNVLLYGDSGTGKSTSIKASLNMFYDKGLRMIQVQKHQFVHLGALTEKLKNRNYRFVIYMDDLSFEDFEVEYKYLKAAIEGGLEEKPENVLIYATSNRRHLIKETFSDREGSDDVHRNESIQEKISLSDRFGLSLFYPKPAQQEYFEIVGLLDDKAGITADRDMLIAEARKWGVSHGGYSGRTATQFIEQFKQC
jgi:predicted AAA+ superfamily ATPase